MEEDRDITEWIELYLAGELEGEHLKAFEKRLGDDPLLQQELKLHQELQATFEQDELGFRNELNIAYQEYKHENPTKAESSTIRKVPTYWFSVAATIIVLIGVSTWFYLRVPSGDDTDLFQQYYEPYPVLSTVRGTNDVEKSNFEMGLEAYSIEDYSLALEYFRKANDQDPNTAFLAFYTGMTYLELNQPTEAIFYFEQISNDKDALLNEEILWYSALAMYRKGDFEACKKRLEQITQDEDHYKKKEAKEILSVLKRIE